MKNSFQQRQVSECCWLAQNGKARPQKVRMVMLLQFFFYVEEIFFWSKSNYKRQAFCSRPFWK